VVAGLLPRGSGPGSVTRTGLANAWSFVSGGSCFPADLVGRALTLRRPLLESPPSRVGSVHLRLRPRPCPSATAASSPYRRHCGLDSGFRPYRRALRGCGLRVLIDSSSKMSDRNRHERNAHRRVGLLYGERLVLFGEPGSVRLATRTYATERDRAVLVLTATPTIRRCRGLVRTAGPSSPTRPVITEPQARPLRLGCQDHIGNSDNTAHS
jgi:hypothetical protein